MSKVKEFDPSLQDWRVRILVKILLTPRLRNIHIGVRRPVQSDLKRRNCAHGSHVVIVNLPLDPGCAMAPCSQFRMNSSPMKSWYTIPLVCILSLLNIAQMPIITKNGCYIRQTIVVIFWHFKSSTRDGIPLQTTSCSSELTG
ncbi:hypothetical protein LENED_003568 [Lentinula edodes]|uniref:Uncharacterized protein n=1 Tax=Lentinula edodes TaxID=5353 RepID=A0A1Q3E3Y5_LENED|nr:hypothetical protein LENED_003568 [Lentinula edodes]